MHNKKDLKRKCSKKKWNFVRDENVLEISVSKEFNSNAMQKRNNESGFISDKELTRFSAMANICK